MSKATDRALEKYPLMSEDDKEGLEALKYIGIECEGASVFNEVQESKQAYFIAGYHQAEKDLELTWEDMLLIRDIMCDCAVRGFWDMPDNTYYKEVLKRYKDLKERKQQ